MRAISKLMEVLNINSGEELDDPDLEQEIYESEEPVSTFRPTRRSFTDLETDSYSKSSSKVIPMNTAVSSSKMVITQPNTYDDVKEIGEYLKNRQSVIINLETISKDEGERILDFMGGATFMVEGTIQKVSNFIWLITPRNIEIQNDIERAQYKQQKMSFSWMK